MGVLIKEFGEIQPICNDCGITLCWSIELDEYVQYKEFWDMWCCDQCNPNWKGAYYKYKLNNDKEKESSGYAIG